MFKEKTTSQYRGVSMNKRNGRFIAEIEEAGQHYWLGEYDDEEDAAVAYDKAALRLRGARAKINFEK